MKFTKMHGIGNDYIYLDATSEEINDPERLARRLSHRHRGVGGDGIIIIHPSSQADCRMEMYNADGSRAEMCGNGIRCVAKYILDRGWATGPLLTIETDAGIRNLKAIGPGQDGISLLIEVDMGAPRIRRSDLAFSGGGPPDQPAVDVPLEVEVPVLVGGYPRPERRSILATVISMGNPHCVVRITREEPFSATLENLDLTRIGPALECHAAFPERTNVEFVETRGQRELDFRVWERGSGETLACGTGACAAVVAGALGGYCEREARVHLLGGDLDIRWDEQSGHVFMTGPASEVFTGEVGASWLSSDERFR